MHRNFRYFGYLGLHLLLLLVIADPGQSCPKSNPMVGSEFALTMIQHQLRGVLTIIDDCSFRVSLFDMLPGEDVRWWGAAAPDFVNLTSGFLVSDFNLNDTYKNSSFTVNLMNNVTWDQIGVLAVWDLSSASDFGHVVLNNTYDASLNQSSSSNSTNFTSSSPTMLENCKVLSKDYVVRWNLNLDEGTIDIALEAATSAQRYMAFGWSAPNAVDFMAHADVAVTGFTEEGLPFADDFYIMGYSECLVIKGSSPLGVCPDTVYEPPNSNAAVNNTRLVHGQRRDGVSFIRYTRPLASPDTKYDVAINPKENMTVIWALGTLKPPDSLRPYYLPQYHGASEFVTYGYLGLNVSEKQNDCVGPLNAAVKEDQELIISNSNVPLAVTSSVSLHYPNPPNPSKVLFINKKETPVLQVERGVPVTFSVQAGHDVALYITSNVLGGNATSRNKTETIYAGGAEAEGVPSAPKTLIWTPDRNTPDLVYYQSLYHQKMGWKINVVDGGLSDMYNHSVLLDDQQVTFFWTLSKDSISIAARGEKRSGYIAIAFGTGMVNSYAYVGWIDDEGKGHVTAYWIDGKDAINIHPTKENLTYVRCKSESGIVTMEFTRPLLPSCPHSNDRVCKNIIEPTTPLRVVWSMGSKWSEEKISEKNMHFATSHRPVRVLLLGGSSEAEQDLRPVLAVHGFMMFLAWGILLPGGIVSARYLKHVKGDGWFQIHVYLQYSGLVIVLIGVLFAVAELRVFVLTSLHVKLGMCAIVLACAQPVNAYMRPGKEEFPTRKRVVWEWVHTVVGRSAAAVAVAALFSGLKHLEERYGDESMHGYNWALVGWVLAGVVLVIYLEVRERRRRTSGNGVLNSRFVGNGEDDDRVDLLNGRTKESGEDGRVEIQLEPLNT